MAIDTSTALAPTRWTRPLQVTVGVASLVFTAGTTVQNFVIVNLETLEQMMLLAGADPTAASADAPGFLTGFRVVGCLYIVGNALGILALKRRTRAWLFWVVLGVNLTQAAGVFMVPGEMFAAAVDRFGWVGVLPSAVTDSGALLLSVVLLATLIRYRHPWAQISESSLAGEHDRAR